MKPSNLRRRRTCSHAGVVVAVVAGWPGAHVGALRVVDGARHDERERVVLEAEPTRLIRESSSRVADQSADAPDTMTAYEVALRTLEVTKMVLTFEMAGDAELRCRLEVAIRAELPTPWFVPRVAVEAAGNLLLNVALRIGLEEMLSLLRYL